MDKQFQDMSADELRQIARKLAMCTADQEAQQMSRRCCEAAAVLDTKDNHSLRGLARQVRRIADEHFCTAQVHEIVTVFESHLCMMSRCEEANKEIDALQRQLAEMTAERDQAEAACDRLREQYNEVRELNIKINGTCMAKLFQAQEVIKPFAEFADPTNKLPPEFTVTAGSPMAKPQLTMGHCYAARNWIKAVREE